MHLTKKRCNNGEFTKEINKLLTKINHYEKNYSKRN